MGQPSKFDKKRTAREAEIAAKNSFPACDPDGTVTPCCGASEVTAVKRPFPEPQEGDEEYQRGLIIRGSDETRKTIRQHLDQIRATPTGKKLLKELSNAFANKGKRVLIEEELSESGHADALDKAAQYPSGSQKLSRSGDCVDKLKGTGEGSDSVLVYNTTQRWIGSSKPSSPDDWHWRPAALGLAHELIHAMHQGAGTVAPTYHGTVHDYERQAVGLGSYKRDEITENRIRKEWQEDKPTQRSYYSSPDEDRGVDSGPPQ